MVTDQTHSDSDDEQVGEEVSDDVGSGESWVPSEVSPQGAPSSGEDRAVPIAATPREAASSSGSHRITLSDQFTSDATREAEAALAFRFRGVGSVT